MAKFAGKPSNGIKDSVLLGSHRFLNIYHEFSEHFVLIDIPPSVARSGLWNNGIHDFFLRKLKHDTTFNDINYNNFSLGAYDWKFLSILFSASMVFAIIPTDNYGVDVWWCSILHERNSKAAYLAIIITISIVIINSYCYVSVMRQIHVIEDSLNRKCDTDVWTFILYGVSMNFGGILNGLQYYMVEGWPSKQNPTLPRVKHDLHDDQQPIMLVVQDSPTSIISHSIYVKR
ncbi:8796_t:CDS:2 [Funneliformis mosseae]|uniref:8796_t:CDS:1 n=1 Tax=Funneliformis mosseae TaxID=27381 RepID=A0A9N9HXQ3_FUNMO|nr:8796_t:CDS:2 [Funneliformis mosseae]